MTLQAHPGWASDAPSDAPAGLLGNTTAGQVNQSTSESVPKEIMPREFVPREYMVMATTTPVYLAAREVAGDAITVKLLITPGTDPHDFQLRPRHMKWLLKADRILISGAGLDESIINKSELLRKSVNTSSGLNLLYSSKRVPDPHYWMDPLAVMSQVSNIRKAFKLLDPENEDLYNENATLYIQKLTSLHNELRAGLKAHRGRVLVTSHASFGYFASRYGMRAFSLSGLGAESPLPSQIKAVYDMSESESIGAVFTERHSPDPRMARLRDDLGLKLCELDSIETLDASGDYYMLAMRQNMNTIIKCLGD